MTTKLDHIKAQLEYKQQRLEKANTILKTEFFGIDAAIDQVCANIRTWYILADFQERPIVVNLWGLTGVGKTSLVKRIMELLDLNDSVYHFDMGNTQDESDTNILNIQKVIESEDSKSPRVAIILDEFQHARTLDEKRWESETPETRLIWELLDTGIISKLKEDKNEDKTLNLSKAIIFVIGNLDGAYQMVDNLNSEIHADYFHALSLKITLPKIKKALANLFRNEQISRLGNNHIIYPALSSVAYKQIIAKELKQITNKLVLYSGIQFHLDDSLEHLIYKEGVFPSQGARPIFTTVNTILKSQIPNIISEVLKLDIAIHNIDLKVENSKLVAHYKHGAKIVSTKSFDVHLVLENLRVNTFDDIQAVVAVHESGHAIISTFLLNEIPEHVHSKSADEFPGFVLSLPECDFHYKKEIFNRVAMYLGGMAAEELVFGKDYVTSGSTKDISNATSFLTNMYKLSGLGDSPLRYDSSDVRNNAYHNVITVEKQIKETVEKALELAKTTLNREMKLLLVLADYLCKHPQIEKEDLKAMIIQYGVSKIDFETDKTKFYYLETLQSKVRSITADEMQITKAGRDLNRSATKITLAT
ncbi:hypothetical protein [Formosa sp. A9]|uniref:hypothetical protein n=1 Tax=Formosa sp. A9 TaxID=3442641 RepID=UPI003EBB45C0